MNATHTKNLLAVLTAASAVGFANAGTIDSSSFNGVTNSAISTAGALDWGYLSFDDAVADGIFDSDLGGGSASYNNTPFGSLTNGSGDILTTVSGSSSIGSVTLTEGASGTDVVDSRGGVSSYTFDGNTAYGDYGSLAPTELDVWTLTFNDLGIGTFTITLYMGHTATNRRFDMDYSLTDGGPAVTGTTTVPTNIGDLGSSVTATNGNGAAFAYEIQVTTTTADADLSLTFGSVSGATGTALLSGYTVVPEPGSLALLALGVLGVLPRRRGPGGKSPPGAMPLP